MASVRHIQTGASEPIQVLAVNAARQRLTGLTNLKLFVQRKSDGLYLDWADNAFKAYGAATKVNSTLVPADATGSPGLYHLNETPDHLDGFLDFSALAGKVDGDHYLLTAFQDGVPQSAVNLPQVGEVVEGSWLDFIDQAISDNATPAEVQDELRAIRLHQLVSVNPGAVQPGAGTYIKQILDALGGATYQVLCTFSYNPTADRLEGIVWIESGSLVFNDASLGACTVRWYDKDGVEQFSMADASPDAQGFYKVEKQGPGLAKNQVYYATAEVAITGYGTVSGGKGNFTF